MLPQVLSGQPRENLAVRQSKLSKLPRRQEVYPIKATTSSKSGLYSEAFTSYGISSPGSLTEYEVEHPVLIIIAPSPSRRQIFLMTPITKERRGSGGGVCVVESTE